VIVGNKSRVLFVYKVVDSSSFTSCYAFVYCTRRKSLVFFYHGTHDVEQAKAQQRRSAGKP
jgi:hypothetical protein